MLIARAATMASWCQIQSSEYDKTFLKSINMGENTLRNAEYRMRNSTTYTLQNYRCGMFGYLLAVELFTRSFSKQQTTTLVTLQSILNSASFFRIRHSANYTWSKFRIPRSAFHIVYLVTYPINTAAGVMDYTQNRTSNLTDDCHHVSVRSNSWFHEQLQTIFQNRKMTKFHDLGDSKNNFPGPSTTVDSS